MKGVKGNDPFYQIQIWMIHDDLDPETSNPLQRFLCSSHYQTMNPPSFRLRLQRVRRCVGSQDSGRWESKTQALVVTGHARELPHLRLERLKATRCPLRSAVSNGV